MCNSVPILSICIPAYNRPQWFKRTLESIILANDNYSKNIEIIVSDDSTTDECHSLTQEALAKWEGKWKYVQNKPSLGMAANWNHSIKLALGEYILVLHDDDFLIDNAIANLIEILIKYKNQHSVFLFGVNVVDAEEKLIKKQRFSEIIYLPPKQALLRLMSNSSFVRFPSIVIQSKVFTEVGYFDTTIGGVADLDMWIRLFSKFGILCLPICTCAYTVHSQALTTDMFNSKVIDKLLLLFAKVEHLNIFDQSTLSQCKSQFFYQFILGGTYRQLRQRNIEDATKVMQLFKLNVLQDLPISAKWISLYYLFELIIFIYQSLFKFFS